MRRSTILAGIDVGTTKIMTLIAEVGPDGLPVVLGIGKSPSRGLRKGVVVDIKKTREAVEDSVARAERMAGVNLDSVYVGVTGSHIRSVDTSGAVTVTSPNHEITEADRRKVLEEARLLALPSERKLLHLVEQEYIVDGQGNVTDPVGMSGYRLELKAHVITGSTNFLQNVAKCVEQIDLGVVDLVLEPIASAEAVLEEEEKEVGVAMVDIGGGTSDVAIFRDGALMFTRIIPVGSRHLDSDISVCVGTSLKEAERLKVRHGALSPQQQSRKKKAEHTVKSASGTEEHDYDPHLLAEVVQARTEELLELVKQAIHDSGFEQLIPAGVVFTGGGSLLQGLKPMAEEILQTRVRLGHPRELAFGENVPGKVIRHASAATGLGLLLYATRRLTVDGVQAAAAAPNTLGGQVARWVRDVLTRMGL